MSKKILIVEDDTFLQGLTATKLSAVGYSVALAANGEEAVKVAQKEKPDFILLDLILPIMDGFQALEMIKKDENLKKIPIVIFSNLADDKDIARAKSLGVNDYMIKSNFTLDELAAKIKEVLK